MTQGSVKSDAYHKIENEEDYKLLFGSSPSLQQGGGLCAVSFFVTLSGVESVTLSGVESVTLSGVESVTLSGVEGRTKKACPSGLGGDAASIPNPKPKMRTESSIY
ncbi:hypothetical protein [Pedobacter cryophilus]|uniref:Uncharacterized protein n=1 Tax=Pedobacter cryophilus TaxID=2571271 RepID=A0A4U1C4P1_9SPHI|nr:hypothetical protein [Pedobacter cryophilus]TKB99129.1 hypothetical protein FA046_08450 [Pedobacter cryophilus]